MLRMSPRLWMLAAACGLVLAAPAARAQFGDLFGAPRPPADVPGRGPAPEPWQEPDSVEVPVEPMPPPVQRPRPQMPPPGTARTAPTLPPPGMPSNAPNNARIQSAPLAPPPGSTAAPAAPAAPQPPGTNPGINPPFDPRQPGATPANAPGTEPPPDGNDVIVTAPPAQKIVNKRAVFAGLDKITGRIIAFDVAIEETVQFGALQVTPKACYTRPPTEPQNTDGFIVVDEVTLQGEVRRIFTGWMFASSPGLHAVEHPIYDVWLTDCKGPDTPAVAQTQPEPAPAPAPPKRQQQPRPNPANAAPPPQRPRPPADPFR